MHQHTLRIDTAGRSTIDITHHVQEFVSKHRCNGLLNVFIQHTSASLFINENADPTVRQDLESFLSRLVPDGDPLFKHTAEGPDDMPAHVRTLLTQTSLTIPIQNGQLALGTWQGIYLWEHRHAPHTRKVILTVM